MGHSQLLGMGSVPHVAVGAQSCSSHSSSPTQSGPLILIFLVSPDPSPCAAEEQQRGTDTPCMQPPVHGREMKSQDTQTLGHSSIWEPGKDPGPAQMLLALVGKGGMSMERWWIHSGVTPTWRPSGMGTGNWWDSSREVPGVGDSRPCPCATSRVTLLTWAPLGRCRCRAGAGRWLWTRPGEGFTPPAPADRRPPALPETPQEREQPAQGQGGMGWDSCGI